MSPPPSCDVAIVGAGPTGLTLAALLGRYGLSVVILEKQTAPYPLPRAVHLDGEAMRVLQAAGVADTFVSRMRVNPGMLFKDRDGTVLVDWSREMTVGPMGWHESYRFHQPDLEAALRARIDAMPNVALRWGATVSRVEQDSDGVKVVWPEGAIEARFAVGCDGAGSQVRAVLDTEWEDLGFRERWSVVDLHLTTDRGDLGDHSIQFCDPDRPATYVRGVGARRRFEMRLSPDAPEPDHEAIWQRLQPWISPADAQIERAAVYEFRSRLARDWQRGHVFLAGDAAHQMPPFMGQGLCAGLRDAANLAWKLAAVLGGSDAALMTSYSTERAPNARAFIDMSVALGRLINQTAAGQAPTGRMRSIWPDLGPGLGLRDGIGGALVPQIARADDQAAGGFYALVTAPYGLGLPEFNGGAWLAERGLNGVIVRPDGYALGGAADADGLRALAKIAEPWDKACRAHSASLTL